jgi:hypothetical protein
MPGSEGPSGSSVLRCYGRVMRLRLGAILLALCAACGGKTKGAGSSKADEASVPSDAEGSSDDSAACSLPGETCAGGCIAEGGQCLAGDMPCAGQVSTLSCGESAGEGLHCCMIQDGGATDASDSGPSDDGAQEDGAPLQDAGDCVAAGGTCAQEAGETCMGVVGPQSCPNSVGFAPTGMACCLPQKLECGQPGALTVACPADAGPTLCSGAPTLSVIPGPIVLASQGEPTEYGTDCQFTFPFCSNGVPYQCTCELNGTWSCGGVCPEPPGGRVHR